MCRTHVQCGEQRGRIASWYSKIYGGGGGIRTPETLSGLTVFKTAGFNRSPTPPFPSLTGKAPYFQDPKSGLPQNIAENTECCHSVHGEPRRVFRRGIPLEFKSKRDSSLRLEGLPKRLLPQAVKPVHPSTKTRFPNLRSFRSGIRIMRELPPARYRNNLVNSKRIPVYNEVIWAAKIEFVGIVPVF
jgi:hypothetical protein